jgi:3-oxoacyl-[acyl-carrier protein] reductase
MSKNTNAPRLLLFGATGLLGGSVHTYFKNEGWSVTGVTRQEAAGENLLSWNPTTDSDDISGLAQSDSFDAVCWAQGMNFNDSIENFDVDTHLRMYEANVLFILKSLKKLMQLNKLNAGARLCVISSIWQNLSRQNKMSYCITKSALHGLILSLANDLGSKGYLINAVLPGVVDSPMTRQNLTPEQIRKVEDATLFGRLPTAADVAEMVYSLCKNGNKSVTGQFLTVDLGFSNVRVI